MKDIFCFLIQKDFQVSFWSNLLADVVLTFVIVVLIRRFTSFFKSPKLKFVIKQEGFYRDKILLSKKADGDYEASFILAIRNDGNQMIKANEGYWHTYISTTENILVSAVGEKNHQRDLIKFPVYAKSFLDLEIEYNFRLKKENLIGNKIPYFFSTDYGYFPKTVKMDPKTGKILFKHMAYLEFEVNENL